MADVCTSSALDQCIFVSILTLFILSTLFRRHALLTCERQALLDIAKLQCDISFTGFIPLHLGCVVCYIKTTAPQQARVTQVTEGEAHTDGDVVRSEAEGLWYPTTAIKPLLC